MAPDNLDTPDITPALDMDPRLAAFVQSLVSTQVQQVTLTHQRDWEQARAQVEARERVLLAEIQDLASKLQISETRSPTLEVQTIFPLSDQDTEMSPLIPETVTTTSNHAPRQPRQPRQPRRKAGVVPVPESAPSRNLRSKSTPLPNGGISVDLSPSIVPQPGLASPPASVSRKKPATHLYRMLKIELPEDLGGLQMSLSLHVRVLWGLLDPKAVPEDPPHQALKIFKARFSTDTELYESRNGPELIPRSLVKIGTAISVAAHGRIFNQVKLVEDHMLEYIQACLARFGLTRWCPDFRQTAYSLYNSACRIIALDTFKQALISHAYVHLSPNTTYTSNMGLLIKLYDHFVHHFMFLRYRKEARQPGSNQASDAANPQYKARKRLADARLEFLIENGYPQRYCDLIDVKATSDDEEDPIRKVHIIKRRPERSEKAELFFRILDQKREESGRQTRKWRQRVRIVPQNSQPVTSFPSLPDKPMPIDYFDPTFFNHLQPRIRSNIAVPKVALLPKMEDSFTFCKDERINDIAFTKKYSQPVLKKYHLVFGDELGYDDNDWLDDDDINDDNINDDLEDADDLEDIQADDSDVEVFRQELTNELSFDTPMV